MILSVERNVFNNDLYEDLGETNNYWGRYLNNYYEDEIMQDILTIDADDDIDEIEYIIKQKDLYLKDKPNLELMLVSDVIDEMRKILNPIDFI